VGQQGTLTHVWAERGSRPPAVRDDRHDSAWLFGAVCPERAVGAAVVMPWVSSEAMSEHLAVIGKAVRQAPTPCSYATAPVGIKAVDSCWCRITSACSGFQAMPQS